MGRRDYVQKSKSDLIDNVRYDPAKSQMAAIQELAECLATCWNRPQAGFATGIYKADVCMLSHHLALRISITRKTLARLGQAGSRRSALISIVLDLARMNDAVLYKS
jgi:hypothetical protein